MHHALKSTLIFFAFSAYFAATPLTQADTQPDAFDSVGLPFGANTVDVEFDLFSLPTTVNLCNSSNFANNSGYDLLWVAGIGNIPSVNVPETLITAHTPLQYGCSHSTSAALQSSVEATVFHMDPNNIGNGYTLASMPLNVQLDIANGKIIVQTDRSNPLFSGLSSSTVVGYSTYEGVVSSSSGDFSPLGTAASALSAYPEDIAPQFNFGGSFTDPSNDVCTSSGNCASSAYPEIDLVGGSVHMDDYIFRNGFEP